MVFTEYPCISLTPATANVQQLIIPDTITKQKNTDTRMSSSFALVSSFLQCKLEPFVSHFVYLSFISASLSLCLSHVPGLLNMMTGEHELSVRHSEDSLYSSTTLLLAGIMGSLTNTCKFEANLIFARVENFIETFSIPYIRTPRNFAFLRRL
jgi:hypothetical protein